MPLHQLYQAVGSLAGPNTGVLQGGAGVQVAGFNPNPGISAPRIEESTIEVLDVTAPSLLGAGTIQTLSTPAIAGKLLVMSQTGSQAARWKLNSIINQRVARGQYGIVGTAGDVQTPSNNTAGFAVSTAFGNEAQYGTKAVVYYDGPIQAFVETVANNTAISAGMALAADGAGNLTYAGASPNSGAVLATALGNMAAGVSIPVLMNVQVGGY